MAIKYLCFDMDGTLIDSMDCWNNLKFYMCGRYQKRTGEQLSLTAEDADFISDANLKEAISYINTKYGTELDRDKDALGILREYYKNVATVKSGVVKALEQFKKDGLKMCVITATPKKYTLEVLKHLDLLKYFKFVLTPDEYPKCKRGTRVYLGAAIRFFCLKRNMALIDDAKYAQLTARRAGVFTIGVYDKYRNDRLCDVCRLSFNDFNELLDYYNTNGGF